MSQGLWKSRHLHVLSDDVSLPLLQFSCIYSRTTIVMQLDVDPGHFEIGTIDHGVRGGSWPRSKLGSRPAVRARDESGESDS